MANVALNKYLNDGTPDGMVDYREGYHEEALDGTDKLVFRSHTKPKKRTRIVWQDERNTWREHIVVSTTRAHTSSGTVTESVCENSLNELFGTIVEQSVIKGSVGAILDALLAGTRWTNNGNAGFDGQRFELETWHKSVRECIAELVDMCGGEMATEIEMGASGVAARYVKIVEERGSDTPKRQFRWGRNMGNVKRIVPTDEVYTACIGYGEKLCEIAAKNTDTDAMTDEERAAFEEWLETERKKDYAPRLSVIVESNADLSQWGTPGAGGMGHTWMVYTDDACTDESFLRAQCKSQLKVYSKPLVRYEFDAYQADDDSWWNVKLGNKVHVVDDDMGFDSIERVSYIKRNLKGLDSCRIAIGERANPIVQKFKAEEKTAKKRTGNSAKTAAHGTVTTRGNYTSPSIGGGGGGGDNWIHKVNGETRSAGTINFVTEATPS